MTETMTVTVTGGGSELISPGYARVLFILMVAGFQLLLQGFHAGFARRSVFSKDYLQKHFPQHAKQLKEGLPDMGQGRVADHLPMDKWISFNSAQRAHYNYLEGFATFALAILISGIFYADVSFLLGVCYVIGREVYSRGYRARGASGRFIGVLLLDLALLVLLVLAFYGSFQASGGVEGFQKVFLGAVQQGQVLVEQAQELIKSFSA